MPLTIRTTLHYVVLLIFYALLSSEKLLAQGVMRHPVYVYGSGGGGGGTAAHLHFEVHTIFLKRHCISIGYSLYQRNSKATPDDYNAGGLFGGGGSPEESLRGYTINYGYILYPGKVAIGKLRYPLNIGLLVGDYSAPGNFQRVKAGFFGANYVFDNIVTPTAALLLRTGVEYTPTRFFGLEGGGYVTVGKLSSVGIYAGLLLGYVGSRNRHPHHVKDK